MVLKGINRKAVRLVINSQGGILALGMYAFENEAVKAKYKGYDRAIKIH